MRERRDRVASLLKETVAEIILRETRDPNLKEVTITSCHITRDLHRAVFYFITLNEEREAILLKSLERAKGFIKLKMSKRVRLKFMPEIEFTPYEILKAERKIGKVLDSEP